MLQWYSTSVACPHSLVLARIFPCHPYPFDTKRLCCSPSHCIKGSSDCVVTNRHRSRFQNLGTYILEHLIYMAMIKPQTRLIICRPLNRTTILKRKKRGWCTIRLGCSFLSEKKWQSSGLWVSEILLQHGACLTSQRADFKPNFLFNSQTQSSVSVNCQQKEVWERAIL